ncbi:DNA polymerase III subunit delta [Solimicrobium silvestre]|uniref:DNA polymerase III subunit delta n=1 Tax=Solimicrobium silvestre TaxID=2099400 RepID=A0A2S9H536_9BURK|nr:DNA polymerase III subunit delta [Solimicrobium silvestre]PRC95100.1 holA: DNA polymerase III, delta subunit [Solimicrobium silvestre]
MQLRLDALDAQLAKSLAPLYVVSSDEHLLAQQALDKIRAKARAEGFAEREILTVERSFKWGALLAANQSQSLFGDKKIIDLRIPTGKPGKDGAAALTDYVTQLKNNPNPDNITIISLPKLDWASQKSAWVTRLQDAAVYLDIPLVERAQLSGWIARGLKEQGQSTEREALEFIADRVEGNLLAAHQEIQKLGLLYPAGTLTTVQIQEAVLNVARYDVFKLSEAILQGDIARLVRMLDGLKGEGEALPLVLWALAEECRTLLKLKIGMQEGRPLSAMFKEQRIWGGRERLMEPALRRLSLSTLQNALQNAAQIDKLIKGLRVKKLSGDAWDAVLQLSLSLARA